MLRPETCKEPARPGLSAGFTLMEILVSVVVLALGCLAAIAMQTSTMESGTQAYGLTAATFLAESEAERLQTLDKGHILAVSPNPVRLTRDGRECPNADTPLRYCYVRAVSVKDKYPTAQSVGVSIKVEYPSPAGTQTLYYDTLITSLNF